MLRSVFFKVLHDEWRVVGIWTILSGLLAGFYLSLYPSIGAVAEMHSLLDSMPPALRAMFAAEGADLSTPARYLNVELFTFMIPLLMFAMTLTAGGGATAGEEERGTMELLLANPLPRWRIVAEKFAAMALRGAIVAGGIWLSLAVTARAGGIDLALDRVAAALVSVWLLGLAIGTVAMLVGALTGSRMSSIGVALAVGVLGFFVNALGPLVEALKPWRSLSPHYLYLGNDPLANGLDPAHASALAGMSLALLVLAAIAFERRDLRT